MKTLYAKPQLEELENRCTPSVVVGDFSNGVNILSSNGNWTQISSSKATQLVVDPINRIFGEFPGYGVQKYVSGTTWQQVTPSDASILAVGGTTSLPLLIGEFSNGVNLFNTTNDWKQLTSAHATLLAVSTNFIEFGEFPGYGVQAFVSGTWVQETPSDASQLSAGGTYTNPVIVGTFSNGISQFVSQNSWTNLTSALASLLTVDTAGNIYGEFSGSGVAVFSSNNWISLTQANASVLAAGGGENNNNNISYVAYGSFTDGVAQLTGTPGLITSAQADLLYVSNVIPTIL